MNTVDELLQTLDEAHARVDQLFDQIEARLRHERRRQLVATQAAACDAIGLPMVMPPTGRCYRCGHDLLEGTKVDHPQQPITGCRNCGVSFCD